MNKIKTGQLILLFVIGGITFIHPIYPDEQLLQQAGTFVLFSVMIYDIKKGGLSHLSFSCIAIFTLLHIIAARYLYSFVPYARIIESLSGIDINTLFHTKRNHFDRFVHFSFGLLAFPVLYELFDRKRSLSKPLRLLVVWSFIQAFSGVYEIFEWAITLIMSSESADYYNGQQGDIWDAQKDMFLALIGSTVALITYLFQKKKSH